MPCIDSDQLLMPLPPRDLQPRQVQVVCNFCTHDFVYTMCIRELARLLNIEYLKKAPQPTKWVIFRAKSCSTCPNLHTVPVDENYCPRSLEKVGLVWVYETAGQYYNGMAAEEELLALPNRGGKKSAVIIKAYDDSHNKEEEFDSTDTEYDTDGDPKPRASNAGPTIKKKRNSRRVTRKPHPENIRYRDEVLLNQSTINTEVFTLNGMGQELCTVFSQLLRCFDLSGSWTGSFAHFYADRTWLERVGVQALDAGNDAISVAAVSIIAHKLPTTNHTERT